MNRNPFSTRFTKPGTIPFLFHNERSFGDLCRQAEQLKRCQIVGPHGSGKTTLVQHLIAVWKPHRRILHFSLHDRQRYLPSQSSDQKKWDESAVVVVDGFEQLSWWSKRRLLAKGKRQRFLLMITCHRDQGISTLIRTQVDQGIFERVLRRLLPSYREVFEEQELNSICQKHGQNMREMLFEMYDVWNRRHRRAGDGLRK